MDVKYLSVLRKSRFIHLCFAISFFTSGIIVNIVQAILFYTLHFFNKELYRKINWYLCYTIYTQLVFVGDWWANTKVYVHCNKEDYDKYLGKEHAFCIMNHKYEIDWLIGWMVCERIRLIGNCKAYAKKVIQYIPVLGWCWKFGEFVFLERSFEKDKETIYKQVKELAEYPDPIWLLLFPEGTRFTPKKHEISLEFARKNNLPALKHHLLPRTKGFLASLPSMQGKIHALYDVQIAFDDVDLVEPTITNLLFGRKVTAHLYVRRIPMEDVPKTEPEQEQFLKDLFIRKDKMHESFIQTGDWFTASGLPRVDRLEPPPRIHTLINMLVWTIVILVPMFYYLLKLLLSGKLLYFSIGFSIISLFYIMLKKTIGMSEIKQGSSYGTKTPAKTE